MRTKYERAKDKEEDETLDLSDANAIAKLKRMADAHY